jgi:hypothetical protein
MNDKNESTTQRNNHFHCVIFNTAHEPERERERETRCLRNVFEKHIKLFSKITMN